MRKNGQAFVEDILSGEILLAIEMPPPFKMFMPWQPVFAVGGGGSVLYVRGHHDRGMCNILFITFYIFITYYVLVSLFTKTEQVMFLHIFLSFKFVARITLF